MPKEFNRSKAIKQHELGEHVNSKAEQQLQRPQCHCAWHEPNIQTDEVGMLFATQTQHFERCLFLEESWVRDLLHTLELQR